MADDSILNNRPTLWIDSRTGSKDLLDCFKPFDIPTEITVLPAADVYFTGYGPDNKETSVGIEVKRLSDILTCIRDGRFSGHQLPGLLDTYDRSVLMIEGVWRPGSDGILEEFVSGKWTAARGKFMYRELTAFLLTIAQICGLYIERTSNRHETVMQIATYYLWYQKKWSEHSGHKIMHNRNMTADRNGRQVRLVKPSLLRRVVNQIDHIAGERSAAIAGDGEEVIGYFNSVYDMVLAEPSDWRNIKGIGRKGSQDIVRALRNLPPDAEVEAPRIHREPTKRTKKPKLTDILSEQLGTNK